MSTTRSDTTPAPAQGAPLVAPYALDHLNLHVRDVPAALAFYTGVLGVSDYEVVSSDDAGRPTFVELRVGQQLLYLDEAPGYTPPPDRQAHGLNHLCLLIAPTDPQDLQASLRARGIRIAGTRLGHNPNSFSIYIEDPDGHRVELEQHLQG